jgi:hypothetical protein
VQQHIQLAAGWLRENEGQQLAVAVALAAAVRQRAGNGLQDLHETTKPDTSGVRMPEGRAKAKSSYTAHGIAAVLDSAAVA